MKLNRVITILLSLVFVGAALTITTRLTRAEPAGGVVTNCTDAGLSAALAGGGLVTFNCGANPYTITLSSTKNITINTTIDGGGKITLSGGNAVRQFVVNVSTSLTLKNITLANGHGTFGGCIATLGALTTIQTTLRNCRSAYSPGGFFPPYGGAIAALNGNLYLSNTQILNNIADMNGGGIYLLGSVGQLDGVNLIGNSAQITETGSGGAIYADSGSLLTIHNGQINNNLCGYVGQGCGVASYSNTIQLINVAVKNNHGANASDGGGIFLQGATAVFDQINVSGNAQVYDGGGLTSWNSGVTLTNSFIGSNSASSNGGGINTYLGSLRLNNVTIDGNVVESDGGGIDLYDTPTTLMNVTVSNNQGGRDGGGINHYRNTLNLNNVTVSGNRTSGNAADGGGILNDSGVLIANNTTVDHNSSSNHGGGIYNAEDSTSNLTNVTLSANVAITGGGIYNEPSFSTNSTIVTLTNATLADNSAYAGGGIYNGNNSYNFFFLKNTIIADSHGGNCQGKAFTASKYSLSSDSTCSLVGTGNLNHTPAQLFPLANNGGPTKTHLPALTSPAVNGVGGADFPLSDQRGVTRPQGIGADIGAVERQLSDPVIAPWIYLPLIRR